MLRDWLAAAIAPTHVRMREEFGIISKAKEAVAFAILANETICGKPANVPSATGAAHPVIPGKILPPHAPAPA